MKICFVRSEFRCIYSLSLSVVVGFIDIESGNNDLQIRAKQHMKTGSF